LINAARLLRALPSISRGIVVVVAVAAVSVRWRGSGLSAAVPISEPA
jgi:hypothetical protein